MLKRLKTWWYVWRRWGVWPWQFEADASTLKKLANALRNGNGS